MPYKADIFFQKPVIKQVSNEDLFLQVPLFKRQNPLKPIYINHELYQAFIASEINGDQALSYDLSSLFQVTINEDQAEFPLIIVGYAYVDRQLDPDSKAGHIGSGRSYYLGKYFNIKGEKTPFALNKDGVMDLEKAIWETVASNALQNTPPFSIPPVLAILEREDSSEMIFENAFKTVNNALIIRINLDASLERVSHVHFIEQAFNQQTLMQSAKNVGAVEGGKFIERVAHGMWSAGNMNLNGSIFDMETLCCMRGRNPIYSVIPWYRDNYFGFEYLGQLKVLRRLCTNPRINKDELPFQTIKDQFNQGMKQSLMHGFIRLMGFQDESIATLFNHEIQSLVERFLFLSRLFNFKNEWLYAMNPNTLASYAYDFSNFFRHYPLIKSYLPSHEQEQAFLKHMLNTQQHNTYYDAYYRLYYSADIQRYINKHVYKKFAQYTMGAFNPEDLQLQIQLFIKDYDTLHTHIMSQCQLTYQDIEATAYYLNEERRYLFSYNKYSFMLALKEIKETDNAKIIDQLIKASYRNFRYLLDEKLPTNLYVYTEGFSCCLLNRNGQFQIYIHLFNNYDLLTSDSPEQLQLYFNRERIEFNYYNDSGSGVDIILVSKPIENAELLNNTNFFIQDDGLFLLFFNQRPIKLHLLDTKYF